MNCRKYIAVAVSGVRDILAERQREVRRSQEVRGTDRIQRSSGTGFVHRLVAHGHENPGGHGSWATSHRETARDRHIHAARFTTIKMGAAESTILLSSGKQYRLIELWLRPVRFSMRGSFRAAPCAIVLFTFGSAVSRNRFALSGNSYDTATAITAFRRITWTWRRLS